MRFEPTAHLNTLLFGATLMATSLLPAAAMGQTEEGATRVAGRVVEAGAEDYGVDGARVAVEGTDRAVVCDASGAFVIDDVPMGDVVLLVQGDGFESTRVTVDSASRGAPVEVRLRWADTEGLSATAAVSTERADTAATVFVSPRDISAAPHRNAEEILRQVPGLTLVQHGSEGKGHQFFMRGFDAIHGADLELTMDGIPINEWSNVHAQGYLDLGIIIPELVQGVLVTKGPFTLEQGAFAMAGSAEYWLGAPATDLGWRAAYTVGTTNRHRIFAGYSPPDQNGQQFVGIEATHDDGFGDNRRLQRATINARVQLVDTGDATLALTALGGYGAFALPGPLRNRDVNDGVVDFYGVYDTRARGRSGRAVVALRFDWEHDAHELSLTGYGGYRQLSLLESFTGFLIHPEQGDRRDQSQDTWTFGLRGTHQSRLLDQLALRTGVGIRGDVFTQQELNVDQDLRPFAARRDLDGTQLIVHAYAGLRWSPSATLQVDAGARLDVIHVAVTDQLTDPSEPGSRRGNETLAVGSPRLTARWRPSPHIAFFAAYGRGYRPPEARAFSSFDPGRAGIGEEIFTGGEPTATVSDAAELGARWTPAEWLDMRVTGFATFIRRESVFDHVSGVNLELNGTRRVGAELIVESTPYPWLKLSADLTLVDARFTASGNRVPFAPWLVSGIRATVTDDSGFRAGLRVLTVAPRPLPHGATGATLVMTDATLGYYWRWLRLNLEVENLLNRRLREGEFHYASHWRQGTPASEIPVLHTTAGAPFNMRLTLGVLF